MKKNKITPSISLSLKETLLFREELIDKKEFHRAEAEKLKHQLDAVNNLLESFGVLNFTSFDAHKSFNPIIDPSKNKIFKT